MKESHVGPQAYAISDNSSTKVDIPSSYIRLGVFVCFVCAHSLMINMKGNHVGLQPSQRLHLTFEGRSCWTINFQTTSTLFLKEGHVGAQAYAISDYISKKAEAPSSSNWLGVFFCFVCVCAH